MRANKDVNSTPPKKKKKKKLTNPKPYRVGNVKVNSEMKDLGN